MAKKITEEVIDQMAKLYNEGLSSEIIGKQFGSKAQTVTKLLKKRGLEIRGPKRKLQNGDKEEMIRLYTEEGLSAPKIAEKFGVVHTLVIRYLKQAGVERRSAEECHRIYEINEDFFDVIDTEEKAYFLGFLYADGFNSQDLNAITLSLNADDIEILRKLSRLIYVKDPEDRIKIYDRTHEGKNPEASLKLYSKHMCGVLEKLGCPQAKTFKLKYPEWMPEHLHRHFIRGYFDGDGSIYSRTSKEHRTYNIRIISTLDFIKGVEKIIKNTLNVNFTTSKHAKSEVYYITMCGNRTVKKTLDWIYEGANIFLERKYNRYLDLLSEIKSIDTLCLNGVKYNK